MLNFVALAVITEFDNYSFDSIQTEPLKLLTGEDMESRVLGVAHTTSVYCKDD